jgi:hypothetical protein
LPRAKRHRAAKFKAVGGQFIVAIVTIHVRVEHVLRRQLVVPIQHPEKPRGRPRLEIVRAVVEVAQPSLAQHAHRGQNRVITGGPDRIPISLAQTGWTACFLGGTVGFAGLKSPWPDSRKISASEEYIRRPGVPSASRAIATPRISCCVAFIAK